MRYIPDGFWFKNEVMRTDIFEKDGFYHLDVELPGYKKEDVELEIYDGYLKVSAKHSSESEQKDDKGRVVRSERSYGSCSRSFFVGDEIKAEDVKASYSDGVLNIVVPDRQTKRLAGTQRISIE